MMREDILIWQKFIENGDYLPDRVWYDVKIGQPVEVEENTPEWMNKMSNDLTRKRVDVIGQVGPDFWVIELKPNASHNAFGQVVFYADQFQRENNLSGLIVPVIITDVLDPDLISITSRVGVLVLEVGR